MQHQKVFAQPHCLPFKDSTDNFNVEQIGYHATSIVLPFNSDHFDMHGSLAPEKITLICGFTTKTWGI
jgi:hypothetical protein